MNLTRMLCSLVVQALFTAQCVNPARAPSPQSSRLSSISIGDLEPTSDGSVLAWSRLTLDLEKLGSNSSVMTRSFDRIAGRNVGDPTVQVAYGNYRIQLTYRNSSGNVVYTSCADDKNQEHEINQPTYTAVVRLCPPGGSEPAATTKPGGDAEVVIKPEIAKPKPAPTPAPGASFVDRHGLLQVRGASIVDKNGNPIQLRGMSMYWSHWSAPFWNRDVVSTLKNDWGATLIRAAMSVEEGGYLTNPQAEKDRVKLIVDQAIALGIYVIIDWHDHNANFHADRAIQFFAEMATLYGNTPNVMFEIFNEPINQSWGDVKTYAEAVIRVIREKGAQNIVIVGTPTWSQRVDQAADNPIQASNVAYTLHFYSATHKEDLRNKAAYAISKGIALFVTEFGVCDASGNGAIDLAETDIWMSFMDRYKISWANWSVNDKAESASALKPGTNSMGRWTDNDLTASGAYIKRKILEGQR